MADVIYEVVKHDEGWAYKVGDVYSERFATHDLARKAADDAAARQELAGDDAVISYQDSQGRDHVEVAVGEDRPDTEVKDVSGN